MKTRLLAAISLTIASLAITARADDPSFDTLYRNTGALTATPAGTAVSRPKRTGPDEETRGREYLEKIMDRLKQAEREDVEIFLEYTPHSDGAFYNCKTRRAEDADSPAMATLCTETGAPFGGIAAGKGIWDMGHNDSQLAFVLAHEMGHIIHQDSTKSADWIDAAYDLWKIRREAWLEEVAAVTPRKAAKLRELIETDGWFAWFAEDWLYRDLNNPSPDMDEIGSKDLEIAKAVQDSWRNLVNKQEKAADNYGCALMTTAGYNPDEASRAAMAAGDFYIRTGAAEDPSLHGTYMDRSWELYQKAIRHGCKAE